MNGEATVTFRILKTSAHAIMTASSMRDLSLDLPQQPKDRGHVRARARQHLRNRGADAHRLLYPRGRAHQHDKDLSRNSVFRKYIGCQTLSRRVDGAPLYTRVWGLPNMRYLFVKDTQAQVDGVKTAFAKLCPEGSPQFLFRPYPIIETTRPYYSPKPMPELFAGAWQRVGHPDVFVNAL